MGEDLKALAEMIKGMKEEMQTSFTQMKDELNESKINLEERLNSLEAADNSNLTKQESVLEVTGQDSIRESGVLVPVAREKQLNKQFGVDTSANALLEFLDHYTLCKDMNQQRKVPGWDNAEYRARELRFQLQGEAAVYVRQEETMRQSWVLNDEAIIEKLKDRWLNRDCIEMDILEFEEARQGEYETLAQYMQRLKGLGQRAFSEFDGNGMHQRIIWRFLDGVRDKEIRSAIIRERWMKDRKTPKSYDEVLRIATNAQMTKVAANATGSGSGGQHTAKAKLAALNQNTPNRSGSNRGRTKKPGGNVGRSEAPRAFDCFYCHQRHAGGWRECAKRRKENPTWTPGSDRAQTEGRGGSDYSSPTSPISPTESNASVRSGGSGSSQSFRMSPSPNN